MKGMLKTLLFIICVSSITVSYAESTDKVALKKFIVRVSSTDATQPVQFSDVSMLHDSTGAHLFKNTQATPFEGEITADYANLMFRTLTDTSSSIKVELFQKRSDGKEILLSTAEGHAAVVTNYASGNSVIAW